MICSSDVVPRASNKVVDEDDQDQELDDVKQPSVASKGGWDVTVGFRVYGSMGTILGSYRECGNILYGVI